MVQARPNGNAGDTRIRQQRSDEFEDLIQSFCADAWVVWFAEAANHTETGTLNRPATAELVEAGHGVGEHLRAATGQRGDSGSDALSRGRMRDGGQCRPGVSLRDAPGESRMNPDEQCLPPGLLCRTSQLDHKAGLGVFPERADAQSVARARS